MIIAFHMPHNEGCVFGIITSPNFDTKEHLVDLYEVDATMQSFDTEAAAEEFLVKNNCDLNLLLPVIGGRIAVEGQE